MVSIIIPTYNRSDLIGATINSIIKQTYTNWECLIVDDASNDYTKELVSFYLERDSRLKFFERPKYLPKGANSCRNYGFQKSNGKYIQWFDSDDIMHPKALEIKVDCLERGKVDYVIAKTLNFKDPDVNTILGKNSNYYKFHSYKINQLNYVAQNINWLTYDFLGKRSICSKVKFNPFLKSGQEYNFFSKLTYHSVNTFIIDEFLTYRRMHPGSIRAKKKKSEITDSKFITWVDLAKLDLPSKSEEYLFLDLVKLENRKKPDWPFLFKILINLFDQKRYKTAINLFLYKFSFRYFGKGDVFRRQLFNSIRLQAN